MSECSFKKLVRFLDKQLDLEGKLEILIHLEMCDICREAVYQISRDRDEAYYLYRPYREQRNMA